MVAEAIRGGVGGGDGGVGGGVGGYCGPVGWGGCGCARVRARDRACAFVSTP